VDAHPDGDPDTDGELEAQVDLAKAESDPKRYQLTLRLKLISAGGKKPRYTADIHVVGVLRVAGAWPETAVRQLVQANGPALLYGAAREMLCNVTARGPWPMLCLHSVTFVQPEAPAKPEPATKAAASRTR